jgi:uncharacterized spore protein YtfJ
LSEPVSQEVSMPSEATTSNTPTATAEPPRRRADEILERLADRIGARMVASTIYGSPVERGGVTVIPVAAARFGIGAGGGKDPSKGQEGEGGGGGGMIAPAGYIELKDGRSRFVPIVHPFRMLALVCAAIVAGLAIIRPLASPRGASRVPWR